jgi:ELWxxDGT repeat protein
MLNNSQQRKAMVLSLLMVMLAQTAYIQAYRGWQPIVELQEDENDALRVDSPSVCAAASRTSGTEIHVDVVEGDNTYPGTTNCPKASLGAAVTLAASESASNPEIVLHAGLYHENVSVSNINNLLIRAATGERVVFDGTRSIIDDLGGVWGSADSDGIQEVTLTEDGWQLFLDHEEQVPARWPNAGFGNETVFNRSYWAEGTLTNSNNAYTKGWLTDAGPEAGVHTGLNETVNASGLDPVGAIAVMNLGSFRSNSRIITDWNASNGTFAYDGNGVGWKTKHHAYFLEGKRELIDQGGEWWFNNTNNRLHYKTPSGQNANDLDLRVKVQPFAISVDGSNGVTIQGIDFFGTTVNFNNCVGCSFTNATLEYPSTSKRGLGIAGESEDDRWMTRFYRSTNSFVDNISITNTDGGAIEFQGSPGQTNNNTVNNSYFHAIDWSAADQKGLMVTIYEGGRDMYFTNNTIHLTGASSVLSIGDAPKVFYNEVWDVGHLQTDGAVVQVMQGEASGSEIAYNWIHDVIKYGARFDAPIGQAGTGANGTMHHNVIWNAVGGLMVKGDYHDINNNTVFNSSGKNDMIILTDDDVNNGNSTIHQNAADKMADHRSDSWSLHPLPAGTYWNNWNGYVNTTDTVWNQLVDPANRDFRPKTNSHLDNMSAGAYDAGVSNPWTAGISWTYSTPSAPVAGCMLDYADNYDSDAIVSDGSCTFSSYTPPSSLDLRLHLDPANSGSYSGSGTDLVDLSTYGNDGTIDGATWEANRTRFRYDGSCTGTSGNYVCDEVNFAETNDHDPDANGDWSVSVWMNATTIQNSVIIGKLDGGGTASDMGYIIRIGGDNKLYASVGTTSGSSAVSTSRISIDEDHWYHVVMVADAGNILRLYADGVNVVNASLSGSGSIRNTSSGISIGSYNAGEFDQPFDGNIGEVMIFADALNSTTIDEMYNASKGAYSNTTNLSYGQSSLTMLLGQTYSFPITLANGEVTTSYSLSGTLPSGMTFESSNGTIWGTPTVTMTSTSYTVTANNSAGSYSTSISLSSQHVAPYDLVYSPENMNLTKGTAMTTNTPSVSGGTITSWEISPSVPSGLSFSTSTGAISGTPSVLQTTATTYTIWANNSGGSTSAQVNITINDVVPNALGYAPENMTLEKGTAMTTNTPSVSGGAVTSWEISPSLPTGLTWGTSDGKISGTPTVLQTTATTYTIWANNSGGSASAQVNITINDAIPNALGYTPENMTLEKGTAMTTNTPNASGGAVTSWEISPSLPSGLSFSTSTGALSGTPSVLQTTAITYTIWANNSGGSTSAQVNITINDHIASISYSTPVEISNNRPLSSTIAPTTSGGAITSWEITPLLPTGLTFGTTNGSIWGTPENVTSNETYTIWANNSGGAASATLTLNVVWTLTPSAEGAYITRNSSIASDITWEWDYDPLEAQNLSLVTGEWNTCALDNNGNVFCWGRNGNGQIGNGQTGTAGCGSSGHKCKDTPTATNDLGSDVISLAFGHQHGCGLLDTGVVKCWGRNNNGQLGTSGGDKNTPQTVNLGSGRTATSIYAGGHSTCAILDDASVKCWGLNDEGQLGIGSSSSSTSTPTTISSLGTGRTAVSLATAYNAVCALLDDGSVKCWGYDDQGQLGNGGSNSDLRSPPASAINLGTGRTAKAITGGEFHFCAILDDDSIKCWGEGADGKLGTGSTGNRNTPTSTSGSFASGRYAVAIDAGYDHTCAILDNGQLTCWGSDADGQLGNGATTGTKSSLQSSTVSLGTGRTAISLSAGGEHTCAQLDNGQLKCWGNRADGQVGDNGNFNNPSDRTSPSSVSSNNHGGSTYLNTGVMPSSAVTGATCAISPSLPTGLSLTAGTCTITGTPTATATNATYTIWANVSGQSFSGQIWLEVGLNAPDISYSSSTYTYTKDVEITSLIPSNVGGEVTTWAINATLPSGLTFETSNGTIWGTPDTITSATTYTIWANNSADSDSFTITFTVNAATPNFYYGAASGSGAHTLVLYLNQTMNSLTPNHASGGGAITSCSSSPSLPSGLTLSSSCVLSGTPDATAAGAFYTITGTNTGGSDTASLYIEVRSSGGALTITPTNTEGSVNSSISDITMSYTHQTSNYGWISGVSNTSTTLTNNFLTAGGTHLLGIDSGDQGEMVVVYAHNDTNSASGTYSLAMMYRWGGTWTETLLDNGTDTGYHPSVAIDRQGAIHIAYIDDYNDELRYATNASGSWVFRTLGSSTYDNDNGRGTAIVVHPITDAVHIVTTINDNTYRDLQYHTNESGSWVNTTITNTLSDEGHDPAMAMDGDGNLHVAYYCDDGCSDLRMSSRINGVWQNETVASTLNIGNDPDIAIDSQGTIHIVSQYLNSKRIYLHSGTPGSWTEQTGLSGSYAYWPVVSVDSNDAVHISYHFATTAKDVMYMTNASGSWSTASMINGWGGWGSEMVIDANDDIFIPNIASGPNNFQLTTVKGSGQGLTVRPIYDIDPMLPDGLTMNWRNGTISGTPTEALANTTFTVTVTALGTTTTATFTLYVTGAPGEIAYSDISGTKGTTITPVTPSITTNGTTGSATSWAINASLPTGLTFGTSNGTIWGTPTQVIAGAVFTVWANNSAGSKSTTINITINDVGVTAITYPSENITLTLYHTMTTVTPSTTGGTATTWGISPSLPSGMSFNSATGAISGTPENLQTTAVTYTVWANNSGGDFSDQINITINDYEPVPLNYFGENITLDYNQTMTPLSGFELRPDLMAAGYDHSCAIKDDGTVRCWGEGANGRLGYGGSADKSSPTATSSLGTGRTAVDISAGGDHTCAVLDNGSVTCWGGNAFGQLGDGTTSSRTTPTQTLSLGRPAVAVEVGWYFTCALLDNGAVSCWGKNNQGQLGRGYENASTDTHQATPGLTLPMPGGRPVLTMDISHYMACGVVDNGSIACWGQYGGGKTPSLKTFFSDANPAKDVATGRYSACGLMVNGNVTCWGTGFLGTGGSGQTANPGVIWPNLGSGRTAVHVELGRKHNCALLDNDAVKCWGDDSYGQMGNGASTSNENTPTSVSFASGVVVQDIIAGQWHTCIAAQTNEMYCWGDGVRGKLGDGSTSQNNFAGSSAKVNHFSGTNPVKAHGDITSWAVHPALPTGLALGSTNGTLWGTPTASISQTNFTIYGNNSGGSSSFVLNLGVNAQAPGPFEYNPENNTLTNNTEVYLAPQFINGTTGNGSTWQVADINSGTGHSLPGNYMSILVGDTLYFNADDGSSGHELWAHDTSNASTWRVADINSGTGHSYPGIYMEILIGDTLYFSANDGSSGYELWAHDTSNASTWQVADINSGTDHSYLGLYMEILIGDTLYFSAWDGSSGYELWAHDTSNASTWRVADIRSGSGSSKPGNYMSMLVGDTLYFSADDGSSGWELWAHDTSNASTWRVADIYSGSSGSDPGQYMAMLVGDTLYFSADDGITGHELWAHDTSNASTWQVADINSGTGNSLPGRYMSILVGDTLYFDANGGSSGTELWAHDTSNASTWRVAYFNSPSGSSGPGSYMSILVGDTLYFSADDGSSGWELWAHDTSNASTWQVADINSGVGSSFPGYKLSMLVGDTLYFDASDGSSGFELWAHDTSNASTWQVADIASGFSGSYPGSYMEILVGDTLYFSANDGISRQELWAHRPSTIDYNTNTGGAVTSWAINASLPSGLTFSTTNGSIYGTPTELWTQTSYMVWANNSGGQSVAYLNITVGDELPTLSYSPENLTLTKGLESTDLPLNATLTGPGVITSWAISPALPSGLSFGTSNGTIWGTPTSLMPLKPFRIWANNSGGSVNATVNITVNDEAPDISYSPDWFVLTNNTAMSPTATPTNAGGAIPSTVIDSTGDVGEYSSIVIDSYGFKHISYFDATNTKLKYATDKSGSWVHTTVNTNIQMGKYTSIAIDSEGYVHISYDYYSMSYNHLMYATDKSGSWVNTIADGSAEVGSHTSIAVDSNDTVHISYHDSGSSKKNLKYATCSSSCSSASSWSNVTVDSNGDVGRYTSIAIDSNDALHISYRDSTNDDLKYATCSSSCTSASAWTNSTIDSVGNVGSRTSIAIDSNDAVHISYHDITNGDLKYATDQSGSWANTTVDSVGTVGQYTSIAIDSNDVVHISYYDSTNKDLKYASNMQSSIVSGVGGIIKFVDRDTKVGQQGTSIAVDSNGDVHISYYDAINGDLKYAALQGVHPWNVYGYSISPALPAGLSLNIATW